MDANELKRLNRMELLELLRDQMKENEVLRGKVEDMQAELQDRTLRINKAGSIAEAALLVNGIFEATEASCSQYLENIRRLNENQDAINAQRDRESKEKAQALIEDAAVQCREMEEETKKKCEKMLADADKQVNEKWMQISQRLNNLYSSHEGLLDLVNFSLSLGLKRGEKNAQTHETETQR